jgi:hypothetical protein
MPARWFGTNILDAVHMKKSRAGRPSRITYIGNTPDWTVARMKDHGKTGEYIGIALSSKEFGVIDRKTGVFTSMGND